MTQEMCDKVVDAFLPTLKFVSDRFITNKMLEKLFAIVFSNDNIVFVNEDSDNVTFLVMIMVLIILTLMMIILMKMILKLLFILHL